VLFGWEQFNGSGFNGTSSVGSNVVIGGYGTLGVQFTIGDAATK